MTAILDDLQSLTDYDLAGVFDRAADDSAARSAVLAELGRRDAADRVARARAVLDGIRHEAEVAVHAQYLTASEWCRGRLLSREGMAAGIAERDLSRMPADRLERFQSEELGDYFAFVQPRLTVAAYVRQHAAESRAARLEALDQAEAGASADIAEGITDEHEHDTDEPRLARDDASAFRFVSPAAEAPEAGAGGTVQRGGRGAERAEDGEDASTAAGGPGRPIRPVGRGDSEMGPEGTGGYLAPTFDEVEPDDQHWLWEGYVPEALLTVIIAGPGDGKSNVGYDLAARVSRGAEMPDGTGGGEAGYVVLCAVEDDARTAVWHKLDAARADKSRVVNASDGPDGDGWELSLDGVAWLRAVIAERPGVRMVVIDTLTATATKSITSPMSLRAMLKPLVRLARDTGAAVVLLCHTRKDGRAAGGYTLISTVRQALEIERSAYGPERKLKVLKSNVMPDSGAEGLAFTITGTAPRTRVEWAWNVRSIASGQSSTEQVLTVLRKAAGRGEGPVTAQAIAARTGLSYPHVRMILSRLVRRGQASKNERNAYIVASDDEAASA